MPLKIIDNPKAKRVENNKLSSSGFAASLTMEGNTTTWRVNANTAFDTYTVRYTTTPDTDRWGYQTTAGVVVGSRRY